ncbi:transcriptional regulator ATRX homolog [Dreissena polymorpha]|uniref:transcriptional regulator ATRX homolog n=1 Tax=Dreissena polymorpha TaxID=45954 RepID=UPI0022647B69|nr:transcriptional regulator ATRX homolog [Dreissena polymorpha]
MTPPRRMRMITLCPTTRRRNPKRRVRDPRVWTKMTWGTAAPKELTSEWWAEFVKEEDKYKLELSGKLKLLFEILKMCEDIGDKVLVFSQSLLSLDIIEDVLAKIMTSSSAQQIQSAHANGGKRKDNGES